MHSSLAVTLDGLPLGLAAVKFWSRDKFKGTAQLKRKINPTRVPIETKESIRWLENLCQSVALLGQPDPGAAAHRQEEAIPYLGPYRHPRGRAQPSGRPQAHRVEATGLSAFLGHGYAVAVIGADR